MLVLNDSGGRGVFVEVHEPSARRFARTLTQPATRNTQDDWPALILDREIPKQIGIALFLGVLNSGGTYSGI